MKILVTGRAGQLARSLNEVAIGREDIDLVFTERPHVDLAVPGSLSRSIETVRPDLVINAAAYTAVDRAEAEPELAFRINRDAAGEAAEAAAGIGAGIIQLSTDYVFDGRSRVAYREDDATGPLNVYGASKLAGEEAVRSANPKHLIVRTSWVFSPFGRNFVSTMLDLARTRDRIAVVDDQRGRPTNALDLAGTILDFVAMTGIFDVDTVHVADEGETSWAGLARAIFELSEAAGGPVAEVETIRSSQYPSPAHRPACSTLATNRAEQLLGRSVPRWHEGLEATVTRLLAKPDA